MLMPQKGKIKLTDLQRKVEQALKLCDTETADTLIGEQTDEYRTLIQGAEALFGMIWSLAKRNGVKETKGVLMMAAQGQVILLTLIHYAYALGIKRAREAACK